MARLTYATLTRDPGLDHIRKSLYDRAVEVLGHHRITDITVLMKMYTAVSFTLKFYDVPADAAGMRR